MSWNWRKKDNNFVSQSCFNDLMQNVSNMKLQIRELELELALILKKLKFKYKITKRDLKEEEETEDIKGQVLLPE